MDEIDALSVISPMNQNSIKPTMLSIEIVNNLRCNLSDFPIFIDEGNNIKENINAKNILKNIT